MIGCDGVLGIVLVSIEAVLRVVNHELTLVLEEANSVTNHRQIFIGRGAEDFLHMEKPGLAVKGDHRRFGLQQPAHLLVILDRDPFAAS